MTHSLAPIFRPYTPAEREALRLERPLDEPRDAWLRARVPYVGVVERFADDATCATLVEAIDRAARPAPVNTGRGEAMRLELRNNDRAIFDDVELAAVFFERLAPFVPATLYGAPRTTHPADDGPRWEAVGVNERFRGYRYRPGQRFAPHFDGCFERNEHECSAITALLYLNEDFEGGQTTLLDLGVIIAPRRGTLFLFDHYVLHEGAQVLRGEKHVLRTDVMYRRS